MKPARHDKRKETSLRRDPVRLLERNRQAETGDRNPRDLSHDILPGVDQPKIPNEAMPQYQLSLEKSLERYADLYEYAPVGYMTLTLDGLISDINHTGAALLGMERKTLIHRHFRNYIINEDRDRWHQCFMHAKQQGERKCCELRIIRGDDTQMHAQMDGLHWISENGLPSVRLAFTDISRFKEADQRYLRIFEQATDGIVITDIETGTIIDLNDSLAEMIGRDKSEIAGKQINFLCPPETGDSLCQSFMRHRSEKHGSEIETQFLAKNGKIHHVLIKMSIISMDGRDVELGIVRDVTERQLARAREHHLRDILDHTHDMIFIFSPATLRFEYANKGAIASIGYTSQELINMSAFSILPLIPEPECRAFVAPLLSGKKKMRRFETTVRRKDGKDFPVEAQLQYVQENSDPGMFVAVARNITKRKLAERELRRQKNLLWQVIDTDPNMIFVKDEHGRFLLANRAIADHYGMAVRDMIGKSNREINPNTKEVEKFLSVDREVIQNMKEVILTESMLKNGKQHWSHTVKRPLLQDDGSVNVLGIGVDITDLIESGNKLAESYKELQRLALYLENVRADERAQIARNLHDEMGATLAALKMRIAWLASKLSKSDTALLTETQHISDLVSDGIRTVRQIVSDLRPNLLDDVGLIAAVRDHIKRFTRDTDIECSLSLPEGELSLNEDQSVTIFRIIQESLNNIIKHARASRVDIRIERQGDSLMVNISDNGIGFDTSRKSQSFGLLGIKERALMINASATVVSTPQQGTCVSLIIPASDSPDRIDTGES